MDAVVFEDDDRAYLQWISEHPDGYVINLRRRFDPSYVVLHRASCTAISSFRGMANPGGFTERAYKKLCGGSLSHLLGRLRRDFSSDQPITKTCSLCKPE